MAAKRHTYTHDQLTQYFHRIQLPTASHIFNARPLPASAQLTFLTLLQHHHLVKIPWENLTQHYSWHRVVNVKPLHLFRKIVLNSQGTNRGGYCMEANLFFHHVLLSLGFDVYMSGSRIYSGDEGVGFGGWTHVVNLVTIDGVRYLLDGGFGPQGPVRPLALNEGVVSTQVAPAECRLLYEALPQMLDQRQKVWVYQQRYGPGKEWKTMYCFTDLEFLPVDVESMNFAPWLNKQSFFTHRVVCVRFTTAGEPSGDEGAEWPGSPEGEGLEGEVDGALSLDQDVLKWRRKGSKVLEWKFRNEGERVEALEKYFGIVLADEDREAVKGTAAAISASGDDQ
ncbi:hypothetical protein B0A50_06264 [Salinomyces thailandicus]|uniref:Uncharacterized protein n=1 Tax=Salinomyces thailandicus TaxID=706561 RepID=A0A4U0TT36_9PEZI|nr:hypothetical protein B0A50_06264 [Salinomyces thailandica]